MNVPVLVALLNKTAVVAVVFKRDSQTDTKTKLNQISQFGTSLSWWQAPEPLKITGAPRDVHASLSREPLDERMGVARGWKSGLGYLRGSDFSQLSLAFPRCAACDDCLGTSYALA